MNSQLSRAALVLGLGITGLSSSGISRAGNPCAPVPPGLVGWWKLNGNAADATTLYNGTAVGGSFVAGEVGQGFAPAAVGDGILVPDAPALNPPNFTMDAWVRLEAADLNGFNIGLIWKGHVGGADASSPFGLGVSTLAGGPPVLAGLPFVTVGDGTSSQDLHGSILAPIGSFFHIAATADGATLSLYLNGQLIGSAPQLVTSAPSAFPLQIGGVTQTGAVNPGPSVIDEVELHNRAATAAEILAIYNAGSAGKCPFDPTPVESSTWGGIKARFAE